MTILTREHRQSIVWHLFCFSIYAPFNLVGLQLTSCATYRKRKILKMDIPSWLHSEKSYEVHKCPKTLNNSGLQWNLNIVYAGWWAALAFSFATL